MTERVLIIGGGHAAGQCAASLRQKGWAGEIVIAGEEPFPPYQRPPLSKAYLSGETTAERLFFKPAAFYDKEQIDLQLGRRAIAIDREAREVSFEDGPVIAYDYLVIATGARVRRLHCDGAALNGIGYLRSIADTDALKQSLSEGAKLAIVGAGYIGLEVAAVAAKSGVKVTVLEIADRVMSRVTSPTVSTFFEQLHRAHGVDLRLGVGLSGFAGNEAIEIAQLTDGTSLPCDQAIVGIGVIPNDEIASEAGLETNDGIIVDNCTRTSDPSIFAIGDCTRHDSTYFGGKLRLESVHNALEQGKTAAAAICATPTPYEQVPWFWSDQYDVKLQTVGISSGRSDQEVVRGDPAAKKFSVYYLQSKKLVAVDSINAPADHMIARKIIAGGHELNVEDIANVEFDLRAYI